MQGGVIGIQVATQIFLLLVLFNALCFCFREVDVKVVRKRQSIFIIPVNQTGGGGGDAVDYN